MKKILVLQFRTDKSLVHERTCIVKNTSFEEQDLDFVNVLDPQTKIPQINDLKSYCGIILGGSGEVCISNWSAETKKKILRIKPVLKQAIKIDMPMLNICFGHQLTSYILGGEVVADLNQAETGVYQIILNEAGLNSPIFDDLPQSFYSVEGHKDSVVRLPKEATLLAASESCGVEAYQIKNNIFGVQFHPELNKDGIKQRLELFPSYAKGRDIDELLRHYNPTPFVSKVLENFKTICQNTKAITQA